MPLGLWCKAVRSFPPSQWHAAHFASWWHTMVRRYELGERSYLREKVVTTYEALWRGEDIGASGWTELFCLKVNAEWIQTNVASMPADRLRPVARRLFAECRVRLGEEHEPATQCHALETLSGFFLGLGCRRGSGAGG